MSADKNPTELAQEIATALRYRVGKDPGNATKVDWLHAAIYVVRDRVMDRWLDDNQRDEQQQVKRVYYLSLEFLIGRLTRDALSNLGLVEDINAAFSQLGVDFDSVYPFEPDAALGNGGLGRLAACFMESMATVDVPGYGYGLRYVNGMFRQEIVDGMQVELPETWLEHGNPWELEHRDRSFRVGFGGTTMPSDGSTLATAPHDWMPDDLVQAVAYDTPIVGWRGARVNTLRLWAAVPVDPLLLDRFNAGDHVGALAESNRAEALSRVLYPADSHQAGQELRLRQEYFFCAASLQDIVSRHFEQYGTLRNLADKAAIHLNDTHPAVAVPELLRLLVDHYAYEFDEAWGIASATFAYTNHTLLPEALESWPVELFERLLPRHLQLIYAINSQVIAEARAQGFTGDHIREVSLIGEDGLRRVRMGNLAFVGSHSINGVSALHTDLMRQSVFSQLNRLYPGRISNKTNGVTPRRWLFQSNPGLTSLIEETIGPEFRDDLALIEGIDAFAGDAEFQRRFREVKLANKARLASIVADRLGVTVAPTSLFDIHIKRIHEYKRQLLNVLHAVDLYRQIKDDPGRDITPRVKLFGGKAAPSYHNAKLIIRLINDVGAVINNDPDVAGRLSVLFLPNYNVSLAESMMPAADLSEQISTAGLEASGTGNMKFALNGAITIGTLDGANVEILERVGAENIVIFGLTAAEVEEAKQEGYQPEVLLERSATLRSALNMISAGVFSPEEPGRYSALTDGIAHGDWFMVAADFEAYLEAQTRVEELWNDEGRWSEMAIHNTARVAWFSSDRTIREYASDIWHV